MSLGPLDPFLPKQFSHKLYSVNISVFNLFINTHCLEKGKIGRMVKKKATILMLTTVIEGAGGAVTEP